MSRVHYFAGDLSDEGDVARIGLQTACACFVLAGEELCPERRTRRVSRR